MFRSAHSRSYLIGHLKRSYKVKGVLLRQYRSHTYRMDSAMEIVDQKLPFGGTSLNEIQEKEENVRQGKRREKKPKKRKPPKKRLTHFISVPLVSEGNVKVFQEFKARVLEHIKREKGDENGSETEGKEDTGIDDSVFISERKLHFTLFMLSLDDAEAVRSAKQILVESLRDYRTFQLSCSNLSCFPSIDTPQACNVLFTEPSEHSLTHLKNLSDILLHAFMEKNLLDEAEYKRNYSRETGSITTNYHATLMNAKYKRFGKMKV